MDACDAGPTAQPSPADSAPLVGAAMQVDSVAPMPEVLAADGAATSDGGNAGGSAAEDSFAGLVIGKLAVRGHARLVARALWHAMRLRVVPGSGLPTAGAEKSTGIDSADSSAGTASPSAAIWGAPASLGPAGASAAGLALIKAFSCDISLTSQSNKYKAHAGVILSWPALGAAKDGLDAAQAALIYGRGPNDASTDCFV